ncbi:hypothetical protein EVG20_g9570 [Dentipellis fragilis]|uniref:Protein PBN1 n=1 Tax=Dentipellis fragilis TaxID=205917 RepID=A0A4Y9XYM7_9AGAM|nr:hypothetical protein EVG20_g9570 [Dentipellis fragilis]
MSELCTLSQYGSRYSSASNAPQAIVNHKDVEGLNTYVLSLRELRCSLIRHGTCQGQRAMHEVHITSSSGFHTTLIQSIFQLAPSPSCSWHIFLRLPSQLFVDPYELRHYQEFYTFNITGHSNLESPAFASAVHDSALVLHVTSDGRFRSVLHVQVPLHVRYGQPSYRPYKEPGTISVPIPAPTVFQACTQLDNRLGSATDTIHEVLRFFPTLLNHLSSPPILFANDTQQQPVHDIIIPVGNSMIAVTSEVCTMGLLFVVFVYLVHVAFNMTDTVPLRSQSTRNKIE